MAILLLADCLVNIRKYNDFIAQREDSFMNNGEIILFSASHSGATPNGLGILRPSAQTISKYSTPRRLPDTATMGSDKAAR
ncbi:MAG: hypothetical protein ACI9KN_001200 [Gammaproteobacteria bacterium]|jgi:hypothetical protein